MKEQLLKIVKNPASASAIVGAITFGAGVGIGYVLGRRKKYEIFEPPTRVGLVLNADDLAELQENDHNSEFEDGEDNESEDVQSDVDAVEWIETSDYIDPTANENETGHNDEPENSISARDFIERKMNEKILIRDDPEQEVEMEPVPSNIFAGDNDDWDYEEELAHRSPSAPYVIHKDEFYNDERGYSQSTLTWYAGDEILADEEEQPIYNHADVIGPMLFGHGSGDPNVFHVRNEKTKSEFEILKDPGHFKVEVLGYEIEDAAQAQDLKHAQSPKRFQMD